ncbi:hypothetical protein BEP19_05455 [Ammoniphilus oxalaticus]|uniref:Uncharacterized protein n=1 Tax=Ammoniphilus oxalaticus TaxID=66863 RepID=A0A419SIR1_9BACL|nr:hypothetical protein [Ammoniphilus oxalaticus]RKD23875.1 hypothetical protein BEP19_05455 [Ammoniphilus oxalaticus]
MKRYKYHPTYMKIKAGIQQIILPLGIFQLIRTLFFPTSFDVVLFLIISFIYIGIELDWF